MSEARFAYFFHADEKKTVIERSRIKTQGAKIVTLAGRPWGNGFRSTVPTEMVCSTPEGALARAVARCTEAHERAEREELRLANELAQLLRLRADNLPIEDAK